MRSSAEFLHSKHRWALDQPAAEEWPESWEVVDSRAEFARRQDTGTYDEGLPFVMHRKGYAEETYFTVSYRPIPNDEPAQWRREPTSG